MPAADTARLLATLELQDKFSKTADRAITKVDRIDKRLGAFSGAVNRNMARAVDATVARGVRLFTDSIRDGLDSLAELESATTSVDAAIAATGKTGQVTSGQIADWANQIETSVQAAFDDKAITAATGDLLRYGKVTTSNIKPAMVVMTDLAAKTGDVSSASKILAKALADPTKAAGALRKAGVILTKQQIAQIEKMDKVGDRAGAQRVLLEALAKTTGGAAAASVGKYGDAMNTLGDVSEDAKKALAEGFLPVIERVASKLSTILADPKAVESIRNFGKGIAGAFDKAVTFLEGVNWKAVGDGLGAAAGFAKTLFDAFTSMPPEVQGTIIALAGLNKLSGGAVSGIVGELGKGLIKGVLGMTAGVVNIQAGVVNGAGGGVPGVGGGAGGVGGLLGAAGPAAAAVGVGFALKEGFKSLSTSLFPREISDTLNNIYVATTPLAGLANTLETLPSLPGQIATALKGIINPSNAKPSTFQNAFGAGPVNQNGQMKGWAEAQAAWVDNGKKITDLQHGAVTAIDLSKRATDQAKQTIAQRVDIGSQGVAQRVTSGTSGTTAATNSGSSRVVGAINALPARIPRPVVNVYITPAGVRTSTSTSDRYGDSTGSGGSGSNGTSRPT